MNSRLHGILTGAFQRGLPQTEGVDLRTAALVEAGSLVVRATTLRGSYS